MKSLRKMLDERKSVAQLKPLNEIMARARAALADPDNIRLWRQGIERFDPANPSDAFSHYAGLSRKLVSEAASHASRVEFDGPARFAANDLESVLNPERISVYLQTVNPDADPEVLQGVADRFFNQAMAKAIEDREQLSPSRPRASSPGSMKI